LTILVKPSYASRMAETVSLYDAKTHLSRLVDEAAAGARFVVTKNGKPLAQIIPIEASAAARVLGAWDGVGSIPEDFDAPLHRDRDR
jgi:prevent-host-death family protein